MNGAGYSSIYSGSSGSNVLSHVYIQYPPVRCHVPGSRSLFYDDANKLILAATSDQILSWKTAPYDLCAVPSSDPLREGPGVSVRYSLDLKLLAIQHSGEEIRIWNKESGDTFSQKCSGLDLYSYNFESKSLRLVEAKKINISWYIYTHESRLVLLASGMQCKSFTGYQLSSAGTIRLPKFEMAMASSDANNKPVLLKMSTLLLCMGSLPIYSTRVAVNVVDNVFLVHQVDAIVVIMYDLFADSQAPISAPLPLLLRGFPQTNLASSQSTPRASLSNDSSNPEVIIYGDHWKFLVLLVVDVSSWSLWKIQMDLEAISASSSEVPLILDFLQRRKLEANKAKNLCLGIVRAIILEQRPISMVARAIDVLLLIYSHAIKTGSYYKRTTKAEETSPSSVSNISSSNAVISDHTSGVNTSDKSIQQERIENESYNRSNLSTSDSDCSGGKTKSYTQVDSSIGKTENASSSQVDPPAGQSQGIGPGYGQLLISSASEQQESSSAAISPTDMYSFVFAPVEEEMTGDGSYLVAIIVEFLRSAYSEKLKVHPNTYVLMVQILAWEERYAELGLFIMNKIIEPSKEVALQLLESGGRQNHHIRKLGLSMLRQLSLHHDYFLLLVQDGYDLEALPYARKFKVNTVRPSLFLEAAYA